MGTRYLCRVTVIGLLALAGCGSANGDLETSQAPSAASADAIEAACSVDTMVLYDHIRSLADMATLSDVVAEVEVVARHDLAPEKPEPATASEEELGYEPATSEAPLYKVMADMRVTTSMGGGIGEGSSLTASIATATTGPQGEREIVLGHEADAALQVGQRAIVAMRGPEGGAYDVLLDGILLVDGDSVGPVCPNKQSVRALAQEVQSMSATAVESQLVAAD